MDFIKQMKKREFIEMGLKALASLLAIFLAIILMEGMIYSIKYNSLKPDNNTSYAYKSSSIAYCVEQSDNKYLVMFYTEDNSVQWTSADRLMSKQECLDLTNAEVQSANKATTVKEVVMHAPNAFIFTITPVHYIVMSVVVAAIAGFFVYKFVALANEYKKIEEKFEKTGTIELA